MSTWPRLRRTGVALAAALLAGGGTTGVAAAAEGAPEVPPSPTEVAAPGLYIVTLTTLPSPDRPGSAARMRGLQDEVLRSIDRPQVLYRFTSALNGFAVELTRDQVKQLRNDRRVQLVERSTKQQISSVDSPDYLGAERAWEATGGPDNAGRGTVVGVIDSGIWPENPSFAALPGNARRSAGFSGACEKGEQWGEADCNSKVVSARYFVKAFGEDNLAASEYLSPRDGTGHGSHVAAVAAGNDRVRVRVMGQSFGQAAGMAPGARIAAYKVCWTAPDPADDGCDTADALAAIDQAVADGVDVISYAITGAPGTESASVELAFLNATASGVFVAAAAGNRGPAEGSVAHTSPWVTTVGASTHRAYQGAIVLGDGETHVGAMVSDRRVKESPLVLAEDVASEDSSAQDARLCRPGSLDAAKAEDKIVVCDRGTIARVEKSAAVARAGGSGMVLTNSLPDTVDADFHEVPTVHLDVAAAKEVKAYLADAERPTASIDPTASDDAPVPQVASFSSRGPAPKDRGSLLKPDLTAPGVSVLAAVAPPSNDGRLWGLQSGTSMSTAHVAGLAAFVSGEHPSWSPAMVKSALSTTADDLEGVSGPLSEGAGQVDATEMLDPGIVFDTPPRRFRGWLAGEVETRNLNLPSIALDGLTGRTRVVRRVTNVSRNLETYTARVEGLEGLGITIRPRTLRLSPGETGRFTVVFDRGTAPLESVSRGHLVWTGLTHQARMPVVVTPRTVSAPDEATGSGATGALSLEGTAGSDGQLDLDVSGLAAARPVGLVLEPGEFDAEAPAPDTDTTRFPISVPARAEVLRVELEGRDSDDLDLHLYRDDKLVAAATGSSADEVLTLVEPDGGDYELFVSSAAAANGATTTAQLYIWVLRDVAVGNLSTASSIPVSAGQTFGVDLSWKDLDPTARWFGTVRYAGSDERTFVTVS